MQHVEPSALAALPDRLSYTHSFLEFAAEDGATIEASAPLVSPLIPTILDAVYTKLLSFDITAKSFVPKTPADPEGNEAPARLQDLHLEHAHIKRQMSFLKGYIVRIAGNRDWTPSSSLWAYMDKVAVMHTGSPGFIHRIKRPALRVECMHLALLLGYLEDILVSAIMGMDIDLPTKAGAIRAWNKLLWIQNDLFARQYVAYPETGETLKA